MKDFPIAGNFRGSRFDKSIGKALIVSKKGFVRKGMFVYVKEGTSYDLNPGEVPIFVFSKFGKFYVFRRESDVCIFLFYFSSSILRMKISSRRKVFLAYFTCRL